MGTLKTVVKKETLVKIIKSMSEINGFTIREGFGLDWLPWIDDEDVNFTFHTHFDYNEYEETGKKFTYITVSASVRRMGGNPTVEDLRKTATRINYAATFMDVFNGSHYAVEEE